MDFYTNFYSRGDTLYYRGYKDGIQCMDTAQIEPTLYTTKRTGSNESTQTTIFGESLYPVTFENPKAAKDFMNSYKSSGVNVYGYPRFDYATIDELFPGEIQFDISLIRIMAIDIETTVNDGFPDIFTANEAITLIAATFRGHVYQFGYKETAFRADDVTYVCCENEMQMLKAFLKFYAAIKVDIITGWNVIGFDLPYMYNRIMLLFSETVANKMSPYGRCRKTLTEFKGKEGIVIEIPGIQVLDYLELYRKFELSPRENYKLSTIAQVELGDDKVEFEGTFKDFYTNNWDLFCDYNAQDARLIDRLDNKLKFIQIACTMAFAAKSNFVDVYRVTRIWDNIIANYLRTNNMHFESSTISFGEPYEGAFVKPTIPGLYEWIASFDVASLYPSLIMQYNISPDTILNRNTFPNLTAQDVIQKTEMFNYAVECANEYNATLCANGAMFSKEKQGFLPKLVELFFAKRVAAKAEMKTWSIEAERVKAEISSRHAY